MHRVLKNQLVFKISTIFFSCAFLFTSFPVPALAQNTSANQAAAYNGGSTSGGNVGARNTAGSAGSCLASSILSNSISSGVRSALGSLSGAATNVTDSLLKVSVSDSTHQDKTELIKQSQSGYTIPYTNTLVGASWDGVAFCIVNTLIEYVADSTIRWANTGFNGSPAFISNTDNFFANLADQEAANFIGSIVSNGTGNAINLCSNFKVSVSIGLSNYYSRSSYRNTSSCTLNKIVGNIDNFMDGNFSEGGWAGWFSMTQNPNNNRIGATILASDELYGRVSAKNNTAKLELGLNNGFLNYKKCTDNSKPETCKTVTPGSVIQSSLEKSLNLPKDRLVMAQKFDQVIESVVNNLIKVALNEVLSSNR